MKKLGPKRRELLARTFADFAKAIFAVGLASRFFKEFGLRIRIFMLLITFLCLTIALLLQTEEKSHD